MMNFNGIDTYIRALSKARSFKIQFSDAAIATAFRKIVQIQWKNVKVKMIIFSICSIYCCSLKTQSDENQGNFTTVEESDVGKAAVNREWHDDELIAHHFLFFIAGFDEHN